jgi:hypothetical protein
VFNIAVIDSNRGTPWVNTWSIRRKSAPARHYVDGARQLIHDGSSDAEQRALATYPQLAITSARRSGALIFLSSCQKNFRLMQLPDRSVQLLELAFALNDALAA